MSKFHGIDMQGKFFIQQYSALPAHTPEDERRLIYVQEEGTLYYSDGSQWWPLSVYSGTVVGTEYWEFDSAGDVRPTLGGSTSDSVWEYDVYGDLMPKTVGSGDDFFEYDGNGDIQIQNI